MPVYEYRCENGHEIEVLQRMSDPPVTECTVCGAAVQRIFRPVAVHFKGSGFYNTDYGKRKRGGGESSDGGSGASSDGGGESKGGSDGAKKDSGSKSDSGSSSSKKSETAA